MFISVLLVASACGGGDSSDNGEPPPAAAGLLMQVSNPAALETSIKAGLTTIRSSLEVTALASDASGAGAAVGNFTGTYTQEANVDEFDAVRYDGEHLYVAPRRYLNCCFILGTAANAANTGNDPVASIRILSTDPGSGSASLQSSIPLKENVSVQGMYLADDRMFALTAEAYYGAYGDFWTDIAIWAPETLGFSIFDVSDPVSPVLETEVSIDGVFVESRRIGNTVYIVSRYTPYIDGLHYFVGTAEQQAENEGLLAGVSLDELLPKVTINGSTQALVRPDRCFVTADATSPGYAVVTTITAVPIDNPDAFTSTCYNEDAYGVYVSENAMYFTEVRADPAIDKTSTRIHKFSLAGTALSYRGSAEIDGQVWRGGQADFRMSEHNGDLRILASEFDWNSDDFVDHTLYVLRESTTRPDLEVVSQLPNATRPAEIGKPNEALFGVRFLADRAYAVTFERIDPLYVIDLSDPSDPAIAGELEVAGFSSFLHPVSTDLLLGVGTGANGGVKVELFDVSDMSLPLSRGSVTVGSQWSFSDATQDRHAFTYQADVNGVDRMAIPVSRYGGQGLPNVYQTALHLFEIRDKDVPSLTTLQTVGSIAPPTGQNGYFASRNRSFIHDDTVYYISDEDVWSAFWQSPAQINGPF
jgi:hypothetical protein